MRGRKDILNALADLPDWDGSSSRASSPRARGQRRPLAKDLSGKRSKNDACHDFIQKCS